MFFFLVLSQQRALKILMEKWRLSGKVMLKITVGVDRSRSADNTLIHADDTLLSSLLPGLKIQAYRSVAKGSTDTYD